MFDQSNARAVVELTVAGERVRLSAERAVYWGSTAMVADVHLGKGDTFRRWGLPMPDVDLSHDLARLGEVVRSMARLLVLGDWVHAAPSERVEAEVAAWRAGVDAEVEVVLGNHDRDGLPGSWRMVARAEGHKEGPFRFVHVPSTQAGTYSWAGHVHPGIVLGRGRVADRLPCFWLKPDVGVLPSFGAFTGSASVRPGPKDGCVLVTEAGLVTRAGRVTKARLR